MHCTNLLQMLQHAAKEFPESGICYIHDDGSEDFQTYGNLLDQALVVGGTLQHYGLKPGDKAIILTDTNRETITSLWACFATGVVPTVLVPPVTITDHSQASAKLLNVFELLSKPMIIASKPVKGADDTLNQRVKLFNTLLGNSRHTGYQADADEIAFIQFSSGSTGEPKGIQLSHRNLLINMNAIAEGLQLKHDDHTGNWMPLYHDMGLIGYHLTPIYVTHSQYHIETVDFIKNPSLWLNMLSSKKIGISGCPNFGLALVNRFLKRKPELPEWNFASMKALLNGAEPISVRIMDEFISNVRQYGFPEEAMMPVYGMAEATLAITFTPLMTASVITSFDADELDCNQKAVALHDNPNHHRKGRIICGVGKPIRDISIRIADDNDVPLDEKQTGHIQIKGPSVTNGYFRNEKATQAAFCGDWLRTGDIGFFHQGNLYISGRHKDIIFMNGKNYFANDLENLACSLPEFTYGKIAFGGITDARSGKDRIILFAGGIPSGQAVEILREVRALFRKMLGIPIDELVSLRSTDFPKTSSGKIQRYKILHRYQQGDFNDHRIR